jgi:hypothetical protein
MYFIGLGSQLKKQGQLRPELRLGVRRGVRFLGVRETGLRFIERLGVRLGGLRIDDVFVVCVVFINMLHTGQTTRSFGAPKPVSCPTMTDLSMPFALQFGFTHIARTFISASPLFYCLPPQ